jgi:hypothetical protein
MKKVLNYILLSGLTLFVGINSTFAAKECVYCSSDSLGIPVGIPNFVSSLVNVAKVLIPILLIVMGMVRYAKVVMSGDDKVIKETNQSFIRSIIAAVFIFLIVSVVQTVFTIIGSDGKSSLACVSCFIGGDCSGITSACVERTTGICTNITDKDKCTDNSSCYWSKYNNKCVENGSSFTPACYKCVSGTTTGVYTWVSSDEASNSSGTVVCSEYQIESSITSQSDCLNLNGSTDATAGVSDYMNSLLGD